MKQNYQLRIEDLNDISGQSVYESFLKKQCDVTAYYFIEHIKYCEESTSALKCFVFLKNNDVVILMPFIVREIHINNQKQPYHDVISPYGYSGPVVCKNANEQDVAEFWKNIDVWYNENNIISEFIRFSLNGNHIGYSGVLAKTLSNVKGRLSGEFEDHWNSFLPKVRNNYRKSEKFNLEFKIFRGIEIDESTINIFLGIYVETMKRKNADSIYYFSRTYFEKLILSNLNNFSIAVAYTDNKPISTELLILHDKTLYAFLGGTNSDYFSYRPNDFLRVNIIKWAVEYGFKYYVLGGGLKDGDGLYKNKKALFPKDEDVSFFTGRKIIDQKKYDELCALSCVDSNTLEQESVSSNFFPKYRGN